MRIECEQCRALVEPTWSVTGAELAARCPDCGHESHATAATTTPQSSPAAAKLPDERECPKCGHRPVTGDACARCGLSVEKMDTWAATDAPPEALATAWDDCVASWDDAAKHDRAASLALTLGEQPWLARQYRAVLRERPGDTTAATRLERTGKIVAAAMLATATVPKPGGYRRGSSLGLLLVLALVVAGGLLWGLNLARKQEPSGVHRPDRTERARARTPARTPAPR